MKSASMADKLTAKQRAFVNEYLIDCNATQAAIRSGYSEHTANEQGSRLLANVKVGAAVKVALDARAAETGYTARWVLEQAADVYNEARTENDRTSALKALDICGKHVDVQAFKERAEITGKDGGPIILWPNMKST